MREEVFFTDIKNGRAQTNVSEKIKSVLPSFENKRVYIKIGVARKVRSLSQNSYYFAVVVPAAQEGVREQWCESISKEQAHELLKTQCNFIDKISEESDGNLKIAKPTHNLNTSEFGEYVERCRQFLFSFFNINIPEPNSQADIHFQE